MPPTCTICPRPDRAAIESALVARMSLRNIATRYDTSTATLSRHRDNCMHDAVAIAHAEQDAEQARSVLQQIVSLQQETLALLSEARAIGKLGTAVMAITAARQNLELLAKLTGELDDKPEVNITINPQWIEVRAVVLNALAAHPAALQDVVHALKAAEEG